MRWATLASWLLVTTACVAPAPPATFPSQGELVVQVATAPPASEQGPNDKLAEPAAFPHRAPVAVAEAAAVSTAEAVTDEPSEPTDEPPSWALSDEELGRRVREDLPSLPPMSVGKPNAGALVNGQRMPEGDHYELVDPDRAWGTPETIGYLQRAIAVVEETHGHVHPLWVGHLSREHGGRFRPHRSHQSGRDVDVSYYYVAEQAEWYRPAVAGTLDLSRTWTFVRALLTETDVELIFIDRRVQKMLKEHALSVGEDREWLDEVFEYGSRNLEPIIRHTWGHRTHIHVRFYNPEAQRLGDRAFDALAARQVIKPRVYTVRYRAKAGDSVQTLAQLAGTSPATFEKLNGTGDLQPGQLYTVPMRGTVSPAPALALPARRLPPADGGGGVRARGVAAGDL
ncbi:MAG: penicillin-insensitive murein endopeptidase [Polyangiaceae bacterium]